MTKIPQNDQVSSNIQGHEILKDMSHYKICSWCEMIQNDEGVWLKAEDSCILEMKKVLSHTICPSCKLHFFSPN